MHVAKAWLKMIPTRILTDRLVLRRYIESDAETLLAASIRNKEHLMKYEKENAILSIIDLNSAAIFIADLEREWIKGKHFFIGLFSKDANEFVGQIYIGEVDPEVPEYRIGYFADIRYEGGGYITEAVKKIVTVLFTEAGVHRISIECDDTNKRSIAVAERCGFTREGHLRDTKAHPNGERTGTFLYGLLKS
ncbi:MAG: N-acetyltransferase [Candidatus Thorarchaeota archaeon]|nr:N-acetyltransferase [Candidatus Thorarchaeota archaeon]